MFVVAVLRLLLSIMLYRAFKSLVLPRVPAVDRTSVRVAIGLGTVVLIFVVVSSTVGSTTAELTPGLAAFAGLGLLGLFALATVPHGLAANRFLIYVSGLGGAAIGVAGQYKDAQVSYGWFIALAGIVTLFVGAVALWTTRRDIIIARSRARAQRAEAEKSAQEIKESHEQYEREKAAAAAQS